MSTCLIPSCVLMSTENIVVCQWFILRCQSLRHVAGKVFQYTTSCGALVISSFRLYSTHGNRRVSTNMYL